ncbi:MAG: tetratricopeptide repeat protein [Sphingobacteriales bacterium JAD_PAG50586_3]|nr:MAG: tetratricopeptide repeat protein [Sphingobacteriales bacterium JAD_PAG50586_3]
MLFIFYNAKAQIDTKQAKLNFDKGISEYNNNNFPSALGYVNKAIAFDSTKYYYYMSKAEIESNMNLYDEAINNINKAIILNNKNSLSHLIKGRIELYGFNNYTGAIESLLKAIKLDSNTVDAYSHLAFAYRYRGISYLDSFDYNNAVKDFSSCINISADYQAYAYRAKSYYYLNDSTNAYKDIYESQKLAPANDTIVYLILAKIEATYNPNCNIAIEAISIYSNNLGQTNKNDEYYEIKAQICICQDDTLGAIGNYNKALNIQPNNISLNYRRLKYLFGDLKYADIFLKDIDSIISKIDDKMQISGFYTIKAMINHLLGNKTEAKNNLSLSLSTSRASKDSSIAYYNLAQYEFFMGNCIDNKNSIINNLNKSVIINPNFPRAYFLYSIAQYLLFKDAITALKILQSGDKYYKKKIQSSTTL